MNQNTNTSFDTQNLLNQIPTLQGVDKAIVSNAIIPLFAEYCVKSPSFYYFSNYYMGNDTTKGELNLDQRSEVDLIPQNLRLLYANEAIKGAISVAQAIHSFDWVGYLKNTQATRVAGQNVKAVS